MNETHTDYRWAWDKFMREAGVMHAGIHNTNYHELMGAGNVDRVPEAARDHIEGCTTCLGVVAYLKGAF